MVNLRLPGMSSVVLLLAAQMAAAQQKPVIPPHPLVKAASARTENGPPQEGIKVHGHWTIVIRNPDGSIASRHEFENSLTDLGKALTLELLVGETFPLRGLPLSWRLKISSNLCHNPGIKDMGDCFIPVTGNKELIGGKLEFAGTIKMDAAGQITSVATQAMGNSGNGPLTFSSRDLTQPDPATGQTPVPINVQAGQNVDFAVDLSIS